jgi:hypothetical protein
MTSTLSLASNLLDDLAVDSLSKTRHVLPERTSGQYSLSLQRIQTEYLNKIKKLYHFPT